MLTKSQLGHRSHLTVLNWKSSVEGTSEAVRRGCIGSRPLRAHRKSLVESASEAVRRGRIGVAQRECIGDHLPREHRSRHRVHTKSLVKRIRSSQTQNRQPSHPVRVHR